MRIEKNHLWSGKHHLADLLKNAFREQWIGGNHNHLHHRPLPEILISRFGYRNGISFPDLGGQTRQKVSFFLEGMDVRKMEDQYEVRNGRSLMRIPFMC